MSELMATLNKQDILTVYNATSKKIQDALGRKDYSAALRHIVFAAGWMYHFNLIYSDPALDKIISEIASIRLDAKTIDIHSNDKVVFIDNFGLDNRGLTQQYLRALIADNKHILYILHNNCPNRESEIIREIKEYEKSEIRIYDTADNDYISAARQIVNEIARFGSDNIFLHIAPWDVTTLLAISALREATVYNINLTDHAFWLGSTLIDYNIEFRGYGELLSRQKRGLAASQQIRLPYYPIVSKYSKFEGFPELPSDAVRIFCGGAEYKMLGKDGIFFKLMDSVLAASDKAHILVAGMTADSVFGRNVGKMRHSDRVHIIGVRKDINEVFAHSDIFLSSYPFCGGLMTQYAASNRLPVLAYAEPDEVNTCEPLVNHFGKPVKMRRSLAEFTDYAKRLIEDAEFRRQEGIDCYNAMMTKTKFDELVNQTLKHRTSNLRFEPEQPDYDSISDFYIDVENNYTHTGLKSMLLHYRFDAFRLMPKMTGDYLKLAINTLYKRSAKGLLSK